MSEMLDTINFQEPAAPAVDRYDSSKSGFIVSGGNNGFLLCEPSSALRRNSGQPFNFLLAENWDEDDDDEFVDDEEDDDEDEEDDDFFPDDEDDDLDDDDEADEEE
ncbi:MAG: hypothetical protein ACKVT0_14810 [Planctomycetaceae bacterium]